MLPFSISRREMLTQCGVGMGLLGLTQLLGESGALTSGSVLFTAHDLHEAPWGHGEQLDALIAEGYVGDAVLIPEYMNACIPVVGRGLATWKITIRRPPKALCTT